MRPQESKQGQLRKLTMQLQMRSWLGSRAGDKDGVRGSEALHGNHLIKSIPVKCCTVPRQPDGVNEMLGTRRNREEEKAEWNARLYPASLSFTLVRLLRFTNAWNAEGLICGQDGVGSQCRIHN